MLKFYYSRSINAIYSNLQLISHRLPSFIEKETKQNELQRKSVQVMKYIIINRNKRPEMRTCSAKAQGGSPVLIQNVSYCC